MKIGTVFLAGAGPGAVDLITVRALEILHLADVVIYDNLSSPFLLRECKGDAEMIFAGKIPGENENPQEKINALLIQKAFEGKTVLRLKGGDPFVFGRGGEEIIALEAAGVPYAVIPGVTSAVAVPEMAGIPVTHRSLSRSFRVITAHGAEAFSAEYFTKFKNDGDETLVFLMGVSSISSISTALLSSGMSAETPACIIERGTTAKSHRIDATLATLSQKARENEAKSPAIIVVGKTADFHLKCKNMALSGVKIGITGTAEIAEKQRKAFFLAGADAFSAPFMKIFADESAISAVFDQNFLEYDWIIFTSSVGVRLFFSRLQKSNFDVRNLCRTKFAVVGSGTFQTLLSFGIRADFVPEKENAESLACEFLEKYGSSAKKVLAFRAKGGSGAFSRAFEKSGVHFTDKAVYESKADGESLFAFARDCSDLDFIAFSSSSAARAFFDCVEKNGFSMKKSAKAVCIGEKTYAECASKIGDARCVKAEKHTADAMVSAVIAEKTHCMV